LAAFANQIVIEDLQGRYPGIERRGDMNGVLGFNPHSPDDALNFGAACAIQM